MIKLIKASAGSGKTYQLTYEYIKMLLGKRRDDGSYILDKDRVEYHQHILAVTFTNKATKEMKDRIINELSALAGKVEGKESPYMEKLRSELHASDTEIREASDKALGSLLFDYTNFRVSTIDSFFQTVLRTFAHEVDISGNYQVGLDADYVVRQGTARMLSDVCHDTAKAGYLKDWLKAYAKAKIQEDKNWNVFAGVGTKDSKGIDGFAQVINKEFFKKSSAKINAYLDDNGEKIIKFRKEVEALVGKTREEGIGAIKKICDIIEDSGVTEISRTGGLQWVKREARIEKLKMDTVLATADKSEKWVKKAAKVQFTESQISEICQLSAEVAERASRYFLCNSILKNLYVLGLLGEINKYVSQYRNENDVVLLSDTNELLKKIINDDDTPFVYERLGLWLNHFLMDEFQDTSQMQWENMCPLLETSLAEGYDNLIIGDEKQSIYRFRNSDYTLLQSGVKSTFDAGLVQEEANVNSVNWRSTPVVVNFNNSLFRFMAEALNNYNADDDIQRVYANVEQRPSTKYAADCGYVEVTYIKPPKKDDADGKTFKEQVLERLPEQIAQLVERGYKQKDIAVLVNKNDEGQDVIASIFNYNASHPQVRQLAVVSEDSLQLGNSPVLNLIISTLRYLDSQYVVSEKKDKTDDDDDEKRVSRKVQQKRLDAYLHQVQCRYEELLNACQEPGKALEQSFASTPRDCGEAAVTSIVPPNAESFSLVSVVERIIKQTVTEQAKRDENAFLQAFQDQVIDYGTRDDATMHGFLKWWDNGGKKMSIASPEGQDAINVMTIHKSKGLEFRCVIIPFAIWEMNGGKEKLWVTAADVDEIFPDIDTAIIPPLLPIDISLAMDISELKIGKVYGEEVKKRIIDCLNKTYVGFTRAISELYVYTTVKKKEANGVPDLIDLLGQFSAVIGGRQTDGEESTTDDRLILGTCPAHITYDEEKEAGLEVEEMPPYEAICQSGKARYRIPEVLTDSERARGTMMHKVMSRIGTRGDLALALKRSHRYDGLTAADIEQVKPEIERALSDERVQEWFAPGNRVYNERNIVSGGERYRPDRFVLTPAGKCIVIDYKFGEVKEKKYFEQVRHYMELLRSTGFKAVEGYIWYPARSEIEAVSATS